MPYDADSLTDLLHQLVKDSPNGKPAKVIAAEVGKAHTRLLNELGNDTGHKADMDLLLPLMNATGSDEPLHWLARMRGGVFIPLARAGRAQTSAERAALQSVKEFGELMGAFEHALEDGRVDREERRRIRKEGYECVQKLMEFLTTIDAEAEAS